MKVYFTVTLAASLVLMSSTTAYAAPTEDQTLEQIDLASAEGNSDGSSQLSPNAPTLPTQTDAGPQLTVGTTKIGIPVDKVGSFATIITKQQIQQMQANSIIDVLKRVPGIDVIQNGGLGQSASIFIRGMNSEHTMVLVDGIEVNDPISPGRTFNFPDQISLDSVDRIEILRGPQSQLYGSDALAGVINIITDIGAEKQTAYIKTQGGSYGTVQGDADWRGNIGKDKFRYTLHSMKQSSSGFSSASSRYGNPERDGYKNTSLSGRFALQPLPNVSLNFISQYANSKADSDNFGSFGGDDPNFNFRNKTLFLGGRSRVTLLNGKFEQITRLSVSNSNQHFNNNTDPNHQYPWDYSFSQYKSQMFKVDVQNNYHLNETNTLTGGAEITNERGNISGISRDYIGYDAFFNPLVDANGNPILKGVTSKFSNRTATNVGLYFQDYIQHTNRWFTTAGIRWDEYNRFGSATTYRGASTFLIPETGTTLRASYGTGFKAPTLYELYSSYGDPNLKAEKSKGWDLGVEQKLFKNSLLIGATYFNNHVNNMIQGNPANNYLYENIGKAHMKGSEVYSTWTPARWLTTRASYTATIAKNQITEQDLLRRPRHKMSFNVNVQPTQKFNLNLDITHIGKASDLDFATYPAKQIKLSSYTLINLAMSYKLTKNCTVFGRLMNILDSPYETVKGYGSPRLSAYGGLQLGI